MTDRVDAEASKERVAAALSEAIAVLSRVKERLPVLQALAKELDRMAAGRHVPARNGLVLQMAHDSADMLVIDLHSLREHMLSEQGLFKIMAAHCRLLRRFTAEDVEVDGLFVGAPEQEGFWKESVRKWMLERWNERFDRVFPGRKKRVREKHVERLRLQFKTDTQPTEEDRNKVRAHRYAGHHGRDEVEAAFQPFEKVEQQITVFERYMRDLLFLVNRSGHAMNWPGMGSADATAQDLADLIVHGSINWATIEYGMAPKVGAAAGNPPPWYWFVRKKFFDDGNLVTAGDEAPDLDKDDVSGS